MSALPLNSRRTLPSPLNHRSSSASRSKVPAVSIEKAWILLYGSEVKSRFLPVMPCTLTAMSRLSVKTTKSRTALKGRDELFARDDERRDGRRDLVEGARAELEHGTVGEVDHRVTLGTASSVSRLPRRETQVGPAAGESRKCSNRGRWHPHAAAGRASSCP